MSLKCLFGYVYVRLGKFKKAELIYRSLLVYQEQEFRIAWSAHTFQPEQPRRLTAYFGQVDEAETKHSKILAKRLSLNESMHPNIAMSYNNLSSLLLNIGRINGYKVRTASEFMSLNIYLQKIILIWCHHQKRNSMAQATQ